MNFMMNAKIGLYGSADDFKGVFRAARAVSDDFQSVFGSCQEVKALEEEEMQGIIGTQAILFGTIGKSMMIDYLCESGKLKVVEILGKREVYKICFVGNSLVIVGSDKRGTIYGLYHLSEMCGISPLRRWSGCAVTKKDSIAIDPGEKIVSKEPSVKYRGIFINDEWPAFGTWAAEHFGGINAKCYEQVFEMLLRLKGNYIWPAMWASNFSLDGPGLAAAQLADEMGIVVSSSHHEPCMRAGAEYGMVRGKDSAYGDAWDFTVNREGLTRFWEDGLKRNAAFESVITLGMRGENDTAIMENATLEDNSSLLRDVLRTQNELIRKTVNPDIMQVPRQIVLFTEVEKFYYGDEHAKGLIGDPETEGVCIMLSDSNTGYTRTLPTEEMRKHNGGYGMYYHMDMHGGPHAYEWVGTSLLSRTWEQMSMAYDYGVREIWVVNVGDIATLELGISYFLDMAYDFDAYGTTHSNNTDLYMQNWVKKHFGGMLSVEELSDTTEVLKLYNQICERRKQEVMNDKVYHPVHFDETKQLLEACDFIIKVCSGIVKNYPAEMLTGFQELIYFPCVGTANLMRSWCYAARNRLYAQQNRNEANLLADLIKEGITFDRQLTEEFHKIADGKFYGFGLSEHFGFTHWCEEDNKYPLRIYTEPANKPRMIVAKEDTEGYSIGKAWVGNRLFYDDFMRPDREKIVLDIACGSKEEIEYQISCDRPWLGFSKTYGKTMYTEKVDIIILRERLSGRDSAVVRVTGSGGSVVEITLNAENKCFGGYEPMTFMEYDGYIAIEAEHCFGKYDTAEGGFKLLKPYGKTGSAMKVYPALFAKQNEEELPYLEYRFEAKTEGDYMLELYFAPSMPVTHKQEMLAGISINDNAMEVFNTVENTKVPYFTSAQWTREAYNNVKVYRCVIKCKLGINSLRYYQISPNLALERLVLYREGTRLPESYLGPKESFYVK